MKYVTYALLVAVAAGLVLPLAGCNTVRGMGQDIEHGGRRIQEVGSR